MATVADSASSTSSVRRPEVTGPQDGRVRRNDRWDSDSASTARGARCGWLLSEGCCGTEGRNCDSRLHRLVGGGGLASHRPHQLPRAAWARRVGAVHRPPRARCMGCGVGGRAAVVGRFGRVCGT